MERKTQSDIRTIDQLGLINDSRTTWFEIFNLQNNYKWKTPHAVFINDNDYFMMKQTLETTLERHPQESANYENSLKYNLQENNV